MTTQNRLQDFNKEKQLSRFLFLNWAWCYYLNHLTSWNMLMYVARIKVDHHRWGGGSPAHSATEVGL